MYKDTVYYQHAVERLSLSLNFEKRLHKIFGDVHIETFYERSLNMLDIYFNHQRQMGGADLTFYPINYYGSITLEYAIGIKSRGRYIATITNTNKKHINQLINEIDEILRRSSYVR